MGLRETLEAATPGPWAKTDGWRAVGQRVLGAHQSMTGANVASTWGENGHNNARLIALAPELAALVLDMGEALTEIRQNGRPDFGDCGAATCEHPGCLYTRKYDALLARLDQLGKEQT